MDAQTLLQNGYRRYNQGHRTAILYQKRVRNDDLATKYFINFENFELPREDCKPVWYCEARLYLAEDRFVDYHIDADLPLDVIEAEIDEFFVRNSCIPDPHN